MQKRSGRGDKEEASGIVAYTSRDARRVKATFELKYFPKGFIVGRGRNDNSTSTAGDVNYSNTS